MFPSRCLSLANFFHHFGHEPRAEDSRVSSHLASLSLRSTEALRYRSAAPDCYHNQILACLLGALIKANTAFLLLIQRAEQNTPVVIIAASPSPVWHRPENGEKQPATLYKRRQMCVSFGKMFLPPWDLFEPRGYFCADEKSLRNVSRLARVRRKK